MTAGGGRRIGQARQILAGLLCVVVLIGGCPQRPSAPETRAAYFVGKLIREPDAVDDLRAVAQFPEERGPDVFLDELPVRTALVYLRARARLGAELGIHAGTVAAPSPDRRRVVVSVTEGLAIGTTEAVRLQVELSRRGDQWMVTRVATD
jgi:hypothetical protein